MKHLTLRDIVEFLFWSLCIVALIVLAGFLESAPLGISMWVAVVLAIFLWIVWAILVVRERKQFATRPKLKLMRNGQWVDVDYSVDPPAHKTAQLFDQDSAAIEHLDYNPKEKQA